MSPLISKNEIYVYPFLNGGNGHVCVSYELEIRLPIFIYVTIKPILFFSTVLTTVFTLRGSEKSQIWNLKETSENPTWLK